MTEPRNKTLVAQRFRRSRPTYQQHAEVQSALARKLIAALPRRDFPRALEFGCGTGMFTRMLRTECRIGTLFLNDLNPFPAENFLPGDIETIALPDRLDLIAANAVWQWLDRPRQLIRKLAEALRPGGIVAVSSFAPGNLAEIAELTRAELNYCEPETLKTWFAANFDILRFETYTHILRFASPRQALEHLKFTGVTGAAAPVRWTRGKLENFFAAYRERFSDGDTVRLTYRPLLLIASVKES